VPIWTKRATVSTCHFYSRVKIRGKRHWLWRAVDQHGVVLDILVQERRDQVAAERFLRRVLDGECGTEPRVVIT
jgi:putative transposase